VGACQRRVGPDHRRRLQQGDADRDARPLIPARSLVESPGDGERLVGIPDRKDRRELIATNPVEAVRTAELPARIREHPSSTRSPVTWPGVSLIRVKLSRSIWDRSNPQRCEPAVSSKPCRPP